MMRLSDDLTGFLASPVMIIIGTRDAGNRPAIGRGLGITPAGPEALDLVFSRWLWRQTALNLATPAPMAVTGARPSDYVSYQVKGQGTLRPMDQRLADLAASYRADIRQVLGGLGIPPPMIEEWIGDRDLVAVRLDVREAYIQTPGPRAGVAL